MFSITIGERSGQVYTFHFDKPEVLIGRVKGNDVILPKQNISKRHAMVRVHGPRFVVEDLGSTNGTYVNGHRIASAVEIGTDDKVYLGDFVMNFIDLSHVSASGSDMPAVPVVSDMPELPDHGGIESPAPAAEGRRRDEGMTGTLRAGNMMSGATGPSQGQMSGSDGRGGGLGGGLGGPGGDDGALFEDQIELGDLDNLLPTSKGDFAGAALMAAGSDWDAGGAVHEDGFHEAHAVPFQEGRPPSYAETRSGHGIGNPNSSDAFEFQDVAEGFAGGNGLKATRHGMASASDFPDDSGYSDASAGMRTGHSGSAEDDDDFGGTAVASDVPAQASMSAAAAVKSALAPGRAASRSAPRPVAVAEHATRAYVSGSPSDSSPAPHDDWMTGPVDGLSLALGTAAVVGARDFDLSSGYLAGGRGRTHDDLLRTDDGRARHSDTLARPSDGLSQPSDGLSRPSDVLGRAHAPLGGLPRSSAASMPSAPVAALRSPTQVDGPGSTPADLAHFDALSLLYRNALRDLRPGVPADAAQMSDTDWAEMEDRVVAFVDEAASSSELAEDADVARLKRDLIYELAGLGPLEPMLDDPEVEAIEVNGPAQIFVFRSGHRQAVPERFSCQQSLGAAVDRLVRATGMVQARATSHADGTLVDGTSVRVVWPPLCPAGPAVLLRKPRAEAPDLDALVERGVVRRSAAILLRHLVLQRRSIAICGVPNVGRRTVVNAVAMLIESPQRIVVVEDGQRLRLSQTNIVRLDSAAQAVAGPSVLQVARRLMPDWILMGEAASLDMADLFSVAADGLPPWLGSFHAQDIGDFIERGAQALVLRHPGIPEAVAVARVTRTVDAVASFGWDEAAQRFILDAVQVQEPAGSGRYRALTLADFGEAMGG